MPNGYGSVTRISGHRKRPWAARISVTDANGSVHRRYVGYAKTREEALMLLTDYRRQPWQVDRETLTFADLYQHWLQEKGPGLSKPTLAKAKTSYGWCSDLYGVRYMDLRSGAMQRVVDDCPRGYQTKAGIVTLHGHLDRYAYEIDVISKMYSQVITVRDLDVPDSDRQPFTLGERKKLWERRVDPRVQVVLTYIYTGRRLMELLTMRPEDIDLETWTMKGGEKTKSGKNRVVPIWTGIRPFVTRILQEDPGEYFIHRPDGRRWIGPRFHEDFWNPLMEELGMVHTPHEARHTFETMLDNSGVDQKCKDLLMGHKSKDVGTRVYTHKTLNQLREAVERLTK